ncbi:MAG TPA: class I SAM-dependent methyltransferase [Armatimonadota bacterium]|nr:class I SAM-dependent methyltransferase [Armatimonadota bacterium]
MNEQEHRRMRAVEDGDWWFVGKRLLVNALLQRVLTPDPNGAVLDVGCGTGANLKLLARYGMPVGIDLAPAALRLTAERGIGSLCAADAEHLGFADRTFNAVTALDVLEHLDHPVRALREMGRVCVPGGIVLVSVPAYPLLWSDHDVALSHRRRYTARLLRAQVEGAGLEVLRLTHAYSLCFLPALLIRQARRLQRHRQPQADLGRVAAPFNALLIQYLRLEAALLPRLSLPLGTSLLCVARAEK